MIHNLRIISIYRRLSITKILQIYLILINFFKVCYCFDNLNQLILKIYILFNLKVYPLFHSMIDLCKNSIYFYF
jgi:hypothetical protein